jgi:hypothetical protein
MYQCVQSTSAETLATEASRKFDEFVDATTAWADTDHVSLRSRTERRAVDGNSSRSSSALRAPKTATTAGDLKIGAASNTL